MRFQPNRGSQGMRAFRRAAHALVDGLPEDATWRTLVERAEVEADIEDAVRGYLRTLDVD